MKKYHLLYKCRHCGEEYTRPASGYHQNAWQALHGAVPMTSVHECNNGDVDAAGIGDLHGAIGPYHEGAP